MKGKILLIPFPFTDLTETKLRPALGIHEGERDVIVAFVSSKKSAHFSEYGVILSTDHPEFRISGLKVTFVIRLDKVATLLKTLVLGELGEVGPVCKEEINKKLGNIFQI